MLFAADQNACESLGVTQTDTPARFGDPGTLAEKFARRSDGSFTPVIANVCAEESELTMMHTSVPEETMEFPFTASHAVIVTAMPATDVERGNTVLVSAVAAMVCS